MWPTSRWSYCHRASSVIRSRSVLGDNIPSHLPVESMYTVHCGVVMIIITVVSHGMYTDDVENDQRRPVGGIHCCILLLNELLTILYMHVRVLHYMKIKSAHA